MSAGGPAPGPARDPWLPASPHTEWLWNVLTLGGPAPRVEAFRQAAAGAGVIPWALDLPALEEEFLLPMLSPPDGIPAISPAGAKLLARRLREAAAANHQAALARMGTDRTCPLDLQRLLPVPAALLALGPEEAASRDWLRRHWGVTRPLRHVTLLPVTLDGRLKKMAQLRIGFWSADWSPWAAIARMRHDWPGLFLQLQPHYPGTGRETDGTAPPAAGRTGRPGARAQRRG